MDIIRYRRATSADVPAMAQCRLGDPAGERADARMAAYLDGRHHPQQTLPERVAYVALAADDVVGYIAGHRTRRFGCDGELQYLYVAPHARRRGVATGLLRQLAEWYRAVDVTTVCVNVDLDSPAARPFYARQGATVLEPYPYWYVWSDIAEVLEPSSVEGALPFRRRAT